MYRYCFYCLYDASFSQFEVYAHHQFLEFLVERIVVQRVFDMEFWLLVLTHVLNDTEGFENAFSSSSPARYAIL